MTLDERFAHLMEVIDGILNNSQAKEDGTEVVSSMDMNALAAIAHELDPTL